MQVTFCFSAVLIWLFCLFVYISETAERICAKFIRKTCFDPRSDEFECEGQRSKAKVTRDKKNEKTLLSHPHCKACAVRRYAANDVTQQQTTPFHRRRGLTG